MKSFSISSTPILFSSIAVFLVVFQEFTDLLIESLDMFLMGLDHLPTDVWKIKVMNQLPEFIIKMSLQRLQIFERIQNLKKRNLFCKLFELVKQSLDLDYANHIRFAFDQL